MNRCLDEVLLDNGLMEDGLMEEVLLKDGSRERRLLQERRSDQSSRRWRRARSGHMHRRRLNQTDLRLGVQDGDSGWRVDMHMWHGRQDWRRRRQQDSWRCLEDRRSCLCEEAGGS